MEDQYHEMTDGGSIGMVGRSVQVTQLVHGSISPSRSPLRLVTWDGWAPVRVALDSARMSKRVQHEAPVSWT